MSSEGGRREAAHAPAKTLAELQAQLDAFAHYYNAIRPHRVLGACTPLQAYSSRVKARPALADMRRFAHFRPKVPESRGPV